MEDPSLQFERDLENTKAGLALDLDPHSDQMLIAFSGLLGRLGPVPLFEFFQVASKHGAKKAYVRDLSQSWYHGGVVGAGDDIPAVAEHLVRLIEENCVTRSVLVGNSAGGYASLLFGRLLNADEVHAFSPQTFIDPAMRAEHGDARYQPFVERMIAAGFMDSRYVDLLPILADGASDTQFHIYFQPQDGLDSLHALRMGEIDNVVLHPVDLGLENKLIKWLRNTGDLTRILKRALDP